MPEKKSGMLDILKGVLKPRKMNSEDIVYQAERVISDYVSRRRNEIICKYKGKKNYVLNVMLVLVSGVLLYCVYRIFS